MEEKTGARRSPAGKWQQVPRGPFASFPLFPLLFSSLLSPLLAVGGIPRRSFASSAEGFALPLIPRAKTTRAPRKEKLSTTTLVNSGKRDFVFFSDQRIKLFHFHALLRRKRASTQQVGDWAGTVCGMLMSVRNDVDGLLSLPRARLALIRGVRSLQHACPQCDATRLPRVPALPFVFAMPPFLSSFCNVVHAGLFAPLLCGCGSHFLQNLWFPMSLWTRIAEGCRVVRVSS
jgi:hypothetical protein